MQKLFFLSFFVFLSSSLRAQDLSLDDLGFKPNEAKENLEEAKLLEIRTKKLGIHQKMGLLTLGLMIATAITAPEGESAKVDVHRWLGITTVASYATTAYFSLSAPEVEMHEKSSWAMTLHKSLMFVHLPGMILTPLAGMSVLNAREKGEPVSGLGKYKSALAYTTITAFALSALSVTMVF